MIQSCVAVLDKGDGHSLRTAPCLESSGSLCILNYQVDGVLASVYTSDHRGERMCRQALAIQGLVREDSANVRALIEPSRLKASFPGQIAAGD